MTASVTDLDGTGDPRRFDLAAEPRAAALLHETVPRVVAWRRHLHRHPEISFAEVETSRFVRAELEAMGLEVTQPTATSVLARVQTGRPGRTIAVRADMDALPVQEEADVPFASEVPGVMHACGHDGHTAVLLGVARLVSELRQHLRGEVRFVFQHAEEQLPSGAPELIEAGVLDGVDAILGQHLWAPLETGRIAVIAGPAMASTDAFEIVVGGSAGHAAFPHTTVDPVAVGAQIVTNLQHITARETDPLQALVVSVTGLRSDSVAHNVIGARARLIGTIRAFDERVRDAGRDALSRIAEHVAMAHRATVTVELRGGLPVLVNDPHLAAVVRDVVRRAYGAAALTELAPLMGSDDFACYQLVVPGVYLVVGAGGGAPRFPHHHPRFTIDEAALEIALRVLTESTCSLLLLRGPDDVVPAPA